MSSVPKQLGRYKIVQAIGQGGMGYVYRGEDPSIGRKVAIKTILLDKMSPQQASELEARFNDEAKAAGKLIHQRIISVYDVGRQGDVTYLVMELVEGEDLGQVLKRGDRIPIERAYYILSDLLEALHYVHEQGIIHRDIKPGNMMLDANGRVKLGDFGIARISNSRDKALTALGNPIGTFRYMSPEQMRGDALDGRSDLWAAGVVLYQVLTGKHPFDGSSDPQIMYAVMQKTPPPPSSINPAIPPAWDAVVAKALEKEVSRRYASARDFALGLRRAMTAGREVNQLPEVGIAMPPPAPPDASAGTTGARQFQPGGTGSRAGIGTSSGPSTSTSAAQESESLFWRSIIYSTDPEDFESYLEQFPNGTFSALARRRLRKLAPTNDTGSTESSGATPQGTGSQPIVHGDAPNSRTGSGTFSSPTSEWAGPPIDDSPTVIPGRDLPASPKPESTPVPTHRSDPIAVVQTVADKERQANQARNAAIAAQKAQLAKEQSEKLRQQQAAELAAQEQLLKVQAERTRVAALDAERERLALEQAQKARADEMRRIALKAEEERLELLRLAAIAAEKARRMEEQAVAAQLARERAEAERLAREKAEAYRLASEKAEAERLAREKAEAERLAREKAEAERLAREKAEAERLAREKAEAERLAREKAEAERLAREKAEAERLAREKAEAERLAREKAEAERLAREKAEAERARVDQEKVAVQLAERQRIESEKRELMRLQQIRDEETRARAKSGSHKRKDLLQTFGEPEDQAPQAPAPDRRTTPTFDADQTIGTIESKRHSQSATERQNSIPTAGTDSHEELLPLHPPGPPRRNMSLAIIAASVLTVAAGYSAWLYTRGTDAPETIASPHQLPARSEGGTAATDPRRPPVVDAGTSSSSPDSLLADKKPSPEPQQSPSLPPTAPPLVTDGEAPNLAKKSQDDQRALAKGVADGSTKRQADELAKKQADELAKKQADELAKKQADELAKKQADELAKKQADELAKKQADELAKKQADELAKKQADELAKKQADELAKKQADELAKKQADELARRREAEVAALRPRPADEPPKPREKSVADLHAEGEGEMSKGRTSAAKRAFRQAAERGHGPSQKRMWEIAAKENDPLADKWQQMAYQNGVAGVPKPVNAIALGNRTAP